jgi:hypothetical protein
VTLVRERTIPTERQSIVRVGANFCGERVSRGQRGGSLQQNIGFLDRPKYITVQPNVTRKMKTAQWVHIHRSRVPSGMCDVALDLTRVSALLEWPHSSTMCLEWFLLWQKTSSREPGDHRQGTRQSEGYTKSGREPDGYTKSSREPGNQGTRQPEGYTKSGREPDNQRGILSPAGNQTTRGVY